MVSMRRALSWWVRDYAYAAYWQVRATLDRSPHGELVRGEKRPVLVLPGVWETWGFLRPLIDPLHAAGHPVHVVPALGRNGRAVPDAAGTVAALLADLDLRDVVVVAHSKGGLIGKYVMAELDPDERVRAMVAVCTPFAGSEYARYVGLRTLRAFAPDDPTTVKLHHLVEANSRITTISGVFDPHIPTAGRLEGGRNLTLDDGGHFRVLANPEVVRTVLEVASGSWPDGAR